MAEEMDFQERTEQATPKRQEEAKKRGQVARSRELNIAAVLLAGAMVLVASRADFGTAMAEIMRTGLVIDRAVLDHPENMAGALADAVLAALWAFAPLLGALAAAAVLGAIAVGGWIFSGEQVSPKFNRLSPLAGLKRIVSMRGLVEVAKSVAKALLIGAAGFGWLLWTGDEVVQLGLQPLSSAIDTAGYMIVMMLVVCTAGMIVVAMADAPFQVWSHNRELRMSRQEVRDELKETEGRPEVRSRIRQLQQQLANRKMLREVPKADVIVTNPTHFAVALRYDEGRMRAPVVIAKGVDHMAARIREIGGQNRVPLFEAPLLARALYWTTNVNQEIPGPLYLAVAQVLTYVFRVRAAVQAGAPWPNRPNVVVDAALAEPRRGRRPETNPDSTNAQ